MSTNDVSKEIEAAFRLSWFYVEAQYAEDVIIRHRAEFIPLYRVVHVLRRIGFDRKLRAGRSMDSLILSRSREHGLRPEQAALQIIMDTDQPGFIVHYREGVFISERRIDIQIDEDVWLPEEIRALADRLVEQPID